MSFYEIDINPCMRQVTTMETKATTFRLKHDVQTALVHLSKILHRPMNLLVNEAVRGYLDQNLPKVESELEGTLANLRAYRKRDLNFEQAIEAFADAEAKFEDNVEGRIVKKKRYVSRKARRAVHA